MHPSNGNVQVVKRRTTEMDPSSHGKGRGIRSGIKWSPMENQGGTSQHVAHGDSNSVTKKEEQWRLRMGGNESKPEGQGAYQFGGQEGGADWEGNEGGLKESFSGNRAGRQRRS